MPLTSYSVHRNKHTSPKMFVLVPALNTCFGIEFTKHTLPSERYFVQLILHRYATIDIFVIYGWVDTRWQQYSTHLHISNKENNTINLGRVCAFPHLCELYPGICLTTEEKAQENLSLLALLLLLLLSLLSSSSPSPLCRVFILIFLRQTMSLGNTVLQTFCCYYSWCLYR